MSSDKPIHVKPSFYAYVFEDLKKIAKKHGYNLALHGSMNRDLDLVAIPWVNEPSNELKMIKEFEIFLTERCADESSMLEHYLYGTLPGGRTNYIINLNRGGHWNNYDDKQYYLDISVTPLVNSKIE